VAGFEVLIPSLGTAQDEELTSQIVRREHIQRQDVTLYHVVSSEKEGWRLKIRIYFWDILGHTGKIKYLKYIQQITRYPSESATNLEF
jgi:hypothetical protein